jgi:hypothetical protein
MTLFPIGALSKDEFLHMCDSIQIKGENFFQGNFHRAMEDFDQNHDDLLDLNEFQQIYVRFPLVFYPLFHFQSTVQEKTLGRRKWQNIHKRQIHIECARQYMTRYLGRLPPLTWEEQWLGCFTDHRRLRLIARQLYEMDMKKAKASQKVPPAQNQNTLGEKMLQHHKKISKGSLSKSVP